METYNEGTLRVYRYEDSKESVTAEKEPVIFLAGPTVRGNQPHLISWRFEAIEIYKKIHFKGALVVPEFTSKIESDKDKSWVPMWEYNGLKRADCILFWIPRTKDKLIEGKIETGLIALTTNWEHGYWFARDPKKVVYGRPDDAYRISYLDIMWNAINAEENFYQESKPITTEIQKTLAHTIGASITTALILTRGY